MAQVHLELANEELAEARKGAELSHDISAHDFLHIGLDLEEQQYVTQFSCVSDDSSSFLQATPSTIAHRQFNDL
jgi:hypothetical protein